MHVAGGAAPNFQPAVSGQGIEASGRKSTKWTVVCSWALADTDKCPNNKVDAFNARAGSVSARTLEFVKPVNGGPKSFGRGLCIDAERRDDGGNGLESSA